MYQLPDLHSLLRIRHVFITQILDMNIPGNPVVQPQLHASRLSWTGAGVEVTPHVAQFRKVVVETEGTLPEAGLVVPHWIRAVELLRLRFFTRDCGYGGSYEFADVEGFGALFCEHVEEFFGICRGERCSEIFVPGIWRSFWFKSVLCRGCNRFNKLVKL